MYVGNRSFQNRNVILTQAVLKRGLCCYTADGLLLTQCKLRNMFFVEWPILAMGKNKMSKSEVSFNASIFGWMINQNRPKIIKISFRNLKKIIVS